MGSFTQVSTVTERFVNNKMMRIKLIRKIPMNEAAIVSEEVPQVNKKVSSVDNGEKLNCIKKIPSTDYGEMKLKPNPTFGTKAEKVNCIEKIPSTDNNGSKTDACEKKLKPNPTLGTKQIIRACQTSKQDTLKENCLKKSSVVNNGTKPTTPAICDKKQNPIAGHKRGSESVLETRERKRLKMDDTMTSICYKILTDIMNLERSKPFHTPPKPAVWGIADYFDIVKKPMDLGTIKQNLLQNKYLGADQFEDDVRLTFCNCIRYNPPGHGYHKSAKELLREFDRLWKPVKMKIDLEHNNTTFHVENKHLESLLTNCDKLPRTALPRKARSFEDLKKLSAELHHIKTVQDAEPKHKPKLRDSLSSKPASFPKTSDGDLSSSSVSRVAKMLDRNSETISKAQHYEQGGKTGEASWQTEKMLLQRRQHQEKATTKSQIKGDKSAARLKTEYELKKQRQAARKAAREAIEMVEKSVSIDDNWKVAKDFEALIRQPMVVTSHGDRSHANKNNVWSRMKSDKQKSPLERLGLYIKEEYQVGDESDYIISADEDDLEEGEIR
ncbi:Transcription factor GTE10 [Bienertia sinuspersici]